MPSIIFLYMYTDFKTWESSKLPWRYEQTSTYFRCPPLVKISNRKSQNRMTWQRYFVAFLIIRLTQPILRTSTPPYNLSWSSFLWEVLYIVLRKENLLQKNCSIRRPKRGFATKDQQPLNTWCKYLQYGLEYTSYFTIMTLGLWAKCKNVYMKMCSFFTAGGVSPASLRSFLQAEMATLPAKGLIERGASPPPTKLSFTGNGIRWWAVDPRLSTLDCIDRIQVSCASEEWEISPFTRSSSEYTSVRADTVA